jgi:Squalene-hopene cyclase C-terminal domain
MTDFPHSIRRNRFVRLSSVALVAMATLCAANTNVLAKDTAAGVDKAKLTQSVNRAVAYFQQAQADDGSWSAASGPGVTALVTASLIRSGRSPDEPTVARALKYLEKFLHDDGGMYGQGSTHTNYETCVAIAAFKEANKDGRYDKLLADAEKYIKEEPCDDGEKHDISSMSYGGAGYGGGKRPDLSNTSFLVDALHSVGRDADDPALQKALVFVSRCQNLTSPENTTEYAGKVNDGGFYYTIAGGGSSAAGETPDGGLRSYGSMTYAGLKSMIYAGVGPDDPRVKAALEWISDHYALAENPGMGTSGLYYYYHTFAKALDATGDATVTDAGGTAHDWRSELFEQLQRTQQENGSWVNASTRWMEGNPNLVTGYALLALSYCTPPAASP